MDIWTGLGVLLALVALVAPVTPAFQNPWVVVGLWLAVAIYATALLSANSGKVASMVAGHPTATTLVFGVYAFLAVAGLVHTYVVPKAIRSAQELGPSSRAAELQERVAVYHAFAAEKPKRIAIYNEGFIKALTIQSLLGDQNRLRGKKDITALSQMLREKIDEYQRVWKPKQTETDSALNGLVARVRTSFPDTEEVRQLIARVSERFPINAPTAPEDEAQAREWVVTTNTAWNAEFKKQFVEPLNDLEAYLLSNSVER